MHQANNSIEMPYFYDIYQYGSVSYSAAPLTVFIYARKEIKEMFERADFVSMPVARLRLNIIR